MGLRTDQRWFARNRTNRVVSGTASGLAARLGVEPLVTRLAFCLLGLAGGLGIVLYVGGLLTTRAAYPVDLPRRAVNERHTAGVCAITTGILIVAVAIGIGPSPRNTLYAALMVSGGLVVWARSEDRTGRPAWNVVGVAIFAIGAAAFATNLEPLSSPAAALVASGGVGAGLLFLVGPWLSRLSDDAASERRARIRSEARAELGAQLHDSVLQTLAVIQRSRTVEEAASLARAQERELRSWMLGETDGRDLDFAAALKLRAATIESEHDVRLDVVAVGTCALDERISGVVDAASEAMSNAAVHSGCASVSVYTEVTADLVEVFVRDEGVGFDFATVPKQRLGLNESIIGRMKRLDGTARVNSVEGEGTEVHLRLPRTRS